MNAEPSRSPGLVTLGLAVLLALAIVVAGRTSTPVFLVLLGAGVVLTAVAAHRWPLATLTTAVLTTLVDTSITPALMPRGFDPSPIGVSEPLLVAAGAVVLIDAIRARRAAAALADPVLPLTVLFVGVSLASAIVNAVPPIVALLGIVVTVDAFAVYFAARMVPVDARSAAVAIAIAVGVIVVAALVGLAQAVLTPTIFGLAPFTGQFGEGLRIGSFVGNPNILAALIGLALPFPLFASRRLEDRRSRWVARGILFVLVLALLLTFSRGGWLAVGIGVLAGAAVFDWRSVPVFVLTVAVAWAVTIVMPRGLLADGGPKAGDGFLDSTIDRFGNLGEADDLRAIFLRDGMRIVTANPVLGVGPGRYGGAVATIIPSPVYDEWETSLYGYRTVHNFWLHLLGETGVAGTAVFLTIIAGLLTRFARAARAATGLRFAVLAAAASALIVGSLNSVTEMIFEGNVPSVLLWLLAGLASCLVVAPKAVRRDA